MILTLWLLATVYAGRVIFFLIGFHREQARRKPNGFEPTVSVVIPARNESKKIERCVRSVLASGYPSDKLEIIVVDDRSTDATPAILDSIARTYRKVHVIHRIEADVDKNLRGKPGALQQGIDHATGDIILLTDADCVVDPNWVRGMSSQFVDSNVGIVCAMTSVRGSTFLERVQDVEWVYTQAMACGGAGNGVALGCFGNNMAIRKRVFEEVGGYRRIAFSVTEDMALQLAVEAAGHKIRYAINTDTRVETDPCDTMAEYIKQRHRWVRGGRGLGIRATVFVATSLVLWTGIVLSIVNASPLWFTAFLALRFVADGILIMYAARSIKRLEILPYIIPSMAILWLTELFLPIISMKRTVEWKGQVFR